MLLIVYRYAFLIVLISFLFFGFLGATCLILPGISLYKISFIDALFISFSAICGVGVTLFPIAHFSSFGKIVLMIIMYIGSVGVLTIILAIIFYFSLYNTEWYGLARELFNIVNIDRIGSFFKIIFLVTGITYIFGLIGYFFLAFYLNTPFSLVNACFLTLNFFTNVGFSMHELLPEVFLNHPFFYIISIILMILGGSGFLLFFEFKEYILKKIDKKLYAFSLTTKTIIFSYFGIILLMWFFYFLFCEDTFSFFSIIRSLFAAISFRACGISPYLSLSPAIIFISSLYGILGTTPFGTGGGIKTSILSIILKTPFSIFCKKDYVILFYKKISWQLVAFAHIFLFYLITLTAFLTIIIELYTESKINFMLIYSDILGFITSSGTLWTPLLNILGSLEKIFCIFLMAIGKISGIILTFYISKSSTSLKQYPDGNLILI